MGSQQNAPLPDGLLVSDYRIVRKIASGGFSIVYLAEDAQGNRFAIKEYMPSTLVKRVAGELAPRVPPEHLSVFRNGLKCFFEEGRTLAQIFHPNVVRVVNFFRANDTVYMVMTFEQGRSLQEIVLKNRGKTAGMVLPERHVLRLFTLVMNGLREVHANRLLHLDLKPANIFVRMDGSPLLLDFGAARKILDSVGGKIFPMYTPGFAAPELYRRQPQLGPWTDIYSLGSTMYACMTGAPPQPADQRELDDRMPANIAKLRGHYSHPIVDVLDWCLKLNSMERPQSVFALQRALRNIVVQTDTLKAPTGGSWFDTLIDRFSGRRGDAKTNSRKQDSNKLKAADKALKVETT